MPKKLTHTQESVEDYFLEQGCKLLDVYVNAKTKMKYRCRCTNISHTNLNNFQRSEKKMCRACAGNKALTQDYVEQIFKDHGCTLTGTYLNSKTKMSYICSCGNSQDKTTLDSFKLVGHCCRTCGNKKISDHQTYTNNYVKEYFEMYGCLALEEYVSSQRKMKFRCGCGETHFISFARFRRGQHNCRKCGFLKITGKNNYLWKQDREKIRYIKTMHSLSWSYKHNFRKVHDKVGDKTVHVDHIYPISCWVNMGLYNLDQINDFDNLQFLPAKENLIKSGKYNKEEFEAYLKLKGIPYELPK